MAISRRQALAAAALLPLAARAARAGTARFVGALADNRGYAVRAVTLAGQPVWEQRLPSRGHGFAVDRTQLIAFARRPGRLALLLDPGDGRVRAEIAPPAGCTFNGHGVLSPDGSRLYATATRTDDDAGLLTVHDRAAGWRAVAAWPTAGRDPHEVMLLGKDLLVANGGWTEGRMPEPGEPFASSLVVLDPKDGRLLARHLAPPELEAISLRHLAGSGGAAAIAAQTRETGLPTLLLLEGDSLRSLPVLPVAGYCGSVAANGPLLCVASPVAGLALVVTADGAIRARIPLADVCGAAPAADGFLLSTGLGVLTGPSATLREAGLRWDNHLAALA